MAKIMLVEDDNNLREIYEARLLAEGHEIISAHDGEEALALAVKERPELIISDVMMPKISGFDMLDILRSSPETKNTKVIMMTALSQLEDKNRAESLGADKYLVKSQVTLEDVIRVAREVLDGTDGGTIDQVAPEPNAPLSNPIPTLPSADDVSQPAPVATPPADVPTTDMPVAAPPQDDSATTTAVVDEPATDDSSDDTTTPEEPVLEAPVAPAEEPMAVEPAPAPEAEAEVTPVTDSPAETPPAEELAPTAEPMTEAAVNDQIDHAQTTSDEQGTVQGQIEDFINDTEAAPINIAADGSMSITEDAKTAEGSTPNVEAIAPATEEPVATDTSAEEPAATPVSSTPAQEPEVTEPETPVAPAEEPTTAEPVAEPPATEPAAPAEPQAPDTAAEAAPATDAPVEAPAKEPESPEAAAEPAASEPESDSPPMPSQVKKVIQPINDPTKKPDLDALVAKEEEKQAMGEVVKGTVITGNMTDDSSGGDKPNPNMIAL